MSGGLALFSFFFFFSSPSAPVVYYPNSVSVV